jgi:hypothetical protein
MDVFSWFEYNIFYVLYPFVTYLLTLPRISLNIHHIKNLKLELVNINPPDIFSCVNDTDIQYFCFLMYDT